VVVIKDRKVAEWRDYVDPLRVFAALEGTVRTTVDLILV
jgi:limonene-1,2-epoxide hydrolase